jgi:hypothetical protein
MADRDATGRFVPGNQAAAGHRRPHAARVAELRSALFDEVTEDCLRRVIRSVLQASYAGDMAAARLVLQYALGNPTEHDLLERLDALEEALECPSS